MTERSSNTIMEIVSPRNVLNSVLNFLSYSPPQSLSLLVYDHSEDKHVIQFNACGLEGRYSIIQKRCNLIIRRNILAFLKDKWKFFEDLPMEEMVKEIAVKS